MSLPPGRALELPGRGQTFIREVQGPPGAPTIFLLHGGTATADLNWFTAFDVLGEHFRVIAPDHRGHGKGINSKSPFRLEDCADDVAAIADVLGINTFIPVGYSMGGTIAQLVWKRHESRVRGLVLCSTAASFAVSREERLSFLGLTGLAVLARLTPNQTIDWLTEQLYMQRKGEGLEPWAIEQMASHDWRKIIEAGSAIGNFDSTSWLKDVDVPTSVVITTQDQVVAVDRQQRLIELLDDVDAHFIDGAHNAVYTDHRTYVPMLLAAISSVHQRSKLLQ
jgi:3-oxoadipate enol-lactonase